LPLSFGLADTATIARTQSLVILRDGDSILKDVTQSLAHKVLQMPIFSSLELMALGFKPTEAFHLVGTMLEGTVHLPSLQVSQAVTKVLLIEDVEKLAKL